jgi:type II secretory pathway pseudopilin PulG
VTKYYFKNFTLIELIITMGTLAVVLVVSLQLFISSQKTWNQSVSRVQVFENANIALELMSREIQCVYYIEDTTPFWFKSTDTSGGKWYSNQSLTFLTYTNLHDESNTTQIAEAKYQLYYTENIDVDSAGWLMRSVTSSNSDKFNYPNNITVGEAGVENAFTANNDSHELFSKMIPYVTNLKFKCYDADDSVIPSSIDTPNQLPYLIEIQLSLLEKISWARWKELGGKPSQIIKNTGEPAEAKEYRKRHERTFTKTVYIGKRGQY